MSAQDLIAKWEAAWAQVLQESMLPEGQELSDEDLEQAALDGMPLRSQLRAGGGEGESGTVEGPCLF
jgi:hypothetical protein